MTDGQEINKLKLIIKDLQDRLYTNEEVKQAQQKILHNTQEELAKVREDAQVQILATEKVQKDLRRHNSELDAINKHHQKLNGELRKEYDALKKANQNLRTKVEQYQDKAAHYRRKAVL